MAANNLIRLFSKQPAKDINPDHGEGQREFGGTAYDEPEPGAKPYIAGPVEVTAGDIFTCHCPKKGPGDKSGQTEEHSRKGADQGAGQSKAARSCPLGAQSCGEQFHPVCGCGEHGEKNERWPAYVRKVISPRGKKKTSEHERGTGNHRQDSANETDQGDKKTGDEQGFVHEVGVLLEGAPADFSRRRLRISVIPAAASTWGRFQTGKQTSLDTTHQP
jgi:hypothetical protein